MSKPVARREVMVTGGALLSTMALGGCAAPRVSTAQADRPVLPPLRASADRIIKVTVCTRPFRAEGPRLDVERVGDKLVVHNYGHGGSGWSLSWGSSAIATEKALATGASEIAVIGCGALGLTSALLLQRAGAAVTIYAKERPPEVRSSLATGLWTPDSRICLDSHATPAFRDLWTGMCRTSFQAYQNFLGVPGEPVEWIDMYHLADPGAPPPQPPAAANGLRFAELQAALVPDLDPPGTELAGDANPFPGRQTERRANMMFNLIEYQRLLIDEFHGNGGRIEHREFHTPADFGGLPQATLINATGYGARALFGDESVVPVRGQLARLVPQPELRYGVTYDNVLLVPRRDGLVVQAIGGDEGNGYGDDTTVPDRAEAERAVATIARAFAPASGA
jgi:hypothetical protein